MAYSGLSVPPGPPLLLLALCLCAGAEPLSPERSLVWGPGLEASITLPVRYFYIQAVDSAGRPLTSSPGSKSFKVTIKALSNKEYIRIHVPDPLDRNDGSFLMRYRMYGRPVYHEYCACPEEDPEVWLETLSCPTKESQISNDFAPFPSIDLKRMLEEVPRRFAEQRGAIVHYTILDNQIYRRSLGKYTDFKMFSDEMLQSLARKVLLPDVEFYINVGDWPVEHRKVNETPGPLPMISWCGSTDSRDIILPTYDITHSTLETLRGVTNDLLSIQGHTGKSIIFLLTTQSHIVYTS
ncbi:hypothetical protein AB205_0047950 [Aquarana catesbeiana]|uniref:Glycosyl transferase CAP10 domain-containing protein n=1 Tax=Aquarana catesbeiana TaxID=8400 RepID=A0A2G9RDL3_AQUCT|nr:hypothetical protein AB205_0047950 [Aquarana catesbeiana]